MAPTRKLACFAVYLALALLAVEWAARHKVRATPAGQALGRYRPAGDHAVFLGSSLTDAGIEHPLIDSLLRPAGLEVHNLALAGLSGSENYWLLLKGFILPRSRPRYLVVEAPGIPFLPPEKPFRLEGEGLRVESFRSEHLDWEGFLHLIGGTPAPADALSFLLHKAWASFHLRHELQARLRERLIPREEPKDAGNPWHMVGDARERMTLNARAGIGRLQSLPDPPAALRGHAAHFLDLADLARSQGISLVVLRPPLPPSDSLTARSEAFAAWNRDFRGLCDSLGVAYLDLANPADCGPNGYTYSDGIHLDEPSSRSFTRCVANFLGRPRGQAIAPGRPGGAGSPAAL